MLARAPRDDAIINILLRAVPVQAKAGGRDTDDAARVVVSNFAEIYEIDRATKRKAAAAEAREKEARGSEAVTSSAAAAAAAVASAAAGSAMRGGGMGGGVGGGGCSVGVGAGGAGGAGGGAGGDGSEHVRAMSLGPRLKNAKFQTVSYWSKTRMEGILPSSNQVFGSAYGSQNRLAWRRVVVLSRFRGLSPETRVVAGLWVGQGRDWGHARMQPLSYFVTVSMIRSDTSERAMKTFPLLQRHWCLLLRGCPCCIQLSRFWRHHREGSAPIVLVSQRHQRLPSSSSSVGQQRQRQQLIVSSRRSHTNQADRKEETNVARPLLDRWRSYATPIQHSTGRDDLREDLQSDRPGAGGRHGHDSGLVRKSAQPYGEGSERSSPVFLLLLALALLYLLFLVVVGGGVDAVVP